jgi:hypothetical protein
MDEKKQLINKIGVYRCRNGTAVNIVEVNLKKEAAFDTNARKYSIYDGRCWHNDSLSVVSYVPEPVITTPGIYLMKNGHLVVIDTFEDDDPHRACDSIDGQWWLNTGTYDGAAQWEPGHDIDDYCVIKRIADLPVVQA